MPEEFLHGADIIAVFQQVGGEGVAEGVATDSGVPISTGWRLL